MMHNVPKTTENIRTVPFHLHEILLALKKRSRGVRPVSILGNSPTMNSNTDTNLKQLSLQKPEREKNFHQM